MKKIRGALLARGLVVLAIVVLGGLPLARPAGASVNSLSIVPATQAVPPGTRGITVSLEANATAPGIGVYDITVVFDRSLLRATACTSNAAGFCDTSVPGAANFSGKSKPTGLTGSPLQIGTVTFQAAATSGRSALQIQVGRLTDPNETDITFPPPSNGEVIISSPNDNDSDGVSNAAEDACAGPGARDLFAVRPERIDGPFAGVDDDADRLVDEALPAGALNFDCDGDGFVGSTERLVFSSANSVVDQACANAWPPDINNDTFVDTGDIGALINHFGKAVPLAPSRVDLAPDPPDGFIDTGDIGVVTNVFGTGCTP